MKAMIILPFLMLLLLPSLATADLQDECGQYVDECIQTGVEIRDVHQFQRENQTELNRFPPEKLTGRRLEEHRRLRERNRVLHGKERELQDRLRQAQDKLTRCVENYKRTHRQGGRSGDEEPFERAVSNIRQRLRENGVDTSRFSW
jgi:hypothetical protein